MTRLSAECTTDNCTAMAEVERLMTVIEDALQIAVMENRDLRMEPWASLSAALTPHPRISDAEAAKIMGRL